MTLFCSPNRICYVASRDGHLVDVLSYVHATRFTPAIAIMLNVRNFAGNLSKENNYLFSDLLLQTGLAIIMIAARNITELIDFFSFIAWIFYGLALASHIVLRYTHPDVKRPIRVSFNLIKFQSFHVFSTQFQNPVVM